LSTLTPDSPVPGLLGYFQVDAQGRFSTPLLPVSMDDDQNVGLTETEIAERASAAETLRQILAQDSVASAPAPAEARADRLARSEAAAPAARNRQIFDELQKGAPSRQTKTKSELGAVAEYELQAFADEAAVEEDALNEAAAPTANVGERKQSVRKVRHTRSGAKSEAAFELSSDQRIVVFESTINTFNMVPLDEAHLAFYREVMLAQERQIQGFVVDRNAFVDTLINIPYRGTRLAEANDLMVALDADVVTVLPATGRDEYTFSPSDLTGGDLILEYPLPPPAQQLRMLITTRELPLGPGLPTVALVATVMLAMIIGGFALLLRLGRQSIGLAEQQQNFVSAVSHELKTPLTSIRMYGEILKAGWASEDKKREYYDFIFSESERLTRLINNTLQLARLSRSEAHTTSLTFHPVGDLLDPVLRQMQVPADNAGFTLRNSVDEEMRGIEVRADGDAFSQVMLNLFDNALKFSANATRKEIEVGVRLQAERVAFYVRDYGPGIPRQQLKKIFTLFYRGESEQTRETSGTGIGLSLVAQLVSAMDGEIDVVNCEPGAEFSLQLRRRLAAAQIE
jgi:signal transduction histidine kinase